MGSLDNPDWAAGKLVAQVAQWTDDGSDMVERALCAVYAGFSNKAVGKGIACFPFACAPQLRRKSCYPNARNPNNPVYLNPFDDDSIATSSSVMQHLVHHQHPGLDSYELMWLPTKLWQALPLEFGVGVRIQGKSTVTKLQPLRPGNLHHRHPCMTPYTREAPFKGIPNPSSEVGRPGISKGARQMPRRRQEPVPHAHVPKTGPVYVGRISGITLGVISCHATEYSCGFRDMQARWEWLLSRIIPDLI